MASELSTLIQSQLAVAVSGGATSAALPTCGVGWRGGVGVRGVGRARGRGCAASAHATRRPARSTSPSSPSVPAPSPSQKKDKAGADPKVAALATEAAMGRRPSPAPDAESGSTFCLGRKGLLTGAVLCSATLLILLLVSRHSGDGAFDASHLAPRRAGPP